MVTEREHTRNGIDRHIGRHMAGWVSRQPDPTRRFAAATAYFAMQCIADGRPSKPTMDALAHSVAKMQGGE